MKQIDKIRAMNAEELAEYLNSVDENGLDHLYCNEQFCVRYREHPNWDYACHISTDCEAAIVAYLESEVEEQ